MRLRDIRDFIASLGITDDEHCYCGKMTDKKDKSIGIYPLKQSQPCKIPLGGMKNGSYGMKAVSLLIHWNRSPTESEDAANVLQEALMSCREVTVNGRKIKFIFVAYDEPIPVDTDENGIFEYVIECFIYYGRSEKK